MRYGALLMVFILCIAATSEAAVNRRNAVARKTQAYGDAFFHPSKYAALVMDARTGEVLYARNAEAKRYPASLTKMMTLYMLFEAMQQGKVTAKSLMPVSRRAAQQPQTNISLKPGERIPVDTAIRALVVRSANDVAVVVAEKLGGSVENFARMMTAKARALGMSSTQFRNPHGLPDVQQFTSARDMAKLGVALRRDFPQYYSYFSVRQFSWKRVPYFTHNRVMLRYAGADGIKTGFINMSGFNVVTSVKRRGRSLVGVVMGGSNAAARDDRMIALLENAQTMLARRGSRIVNIQYRNLPNARNGASQPPAQQTAPKPAPAVVLADRGVMETPAPVPAPVATPQIAVVTPRPPTVITPVVVIAPAAQPVAMPQARPFATVAESNARYAAHVPATAAPATLGEELVSRWGIQVGAFEERAQAEEAARRALATAEANLKGSRIAVLGAEASQKTIHRARLENITEEQARKACQTLISKQSPCFIYRVN